MLVLEVAGEIVYSVSKLICRSPSRKASADQRRLYESSS